VHFLQHSGLRTWENQQPYHYDLQFFLPGSFACDPHSLNFAMASKKRGTYRNQQCITVDFVGNKPISWTVEEEEPSSSSAATLPQASIDQSESSPAQPLQSSQPQTPPTQSSSAELPEPTTDSEFREQFLDYVNNRIEDLQVEGDEGTFAPTAVEKGNYAVEKSVLYMLLAVLHDPSSRPENLDKQYWEYQKSRSPTISHEDFFRRRFSHYQTQLKKIQDLWDMHSDKSVDPKSSHHKRKRTTDKGVETRSMKKKKIVQEDQSTSEEDQGTSEEDQGTSESEAHEADPATRPATTQPTAAQPAASPVKDGRTGKEKTAQKIVPEWYTGRCVLSNALGAQGAHIVPVRSLVRAKRDHNLFLDLLDTFWSTGNWKTRCPSGMIEEANILPLEVGVHYKWDRYNFAVRPISQVSDQDPCRLWVQMVWLKDMHESGGLASGSWDHFSGTITNCRQGFSKKEEGRTTMNFPIVHHGDVFLLQTPDPEKYPLPDKSYLDIQFAVHKMLSGIVAAGALKDIFRGPPPSDGPDVPASAPLPWVWEVMINRAGEIGILNTEEEEQWRQVMRAYFFALDEEKARHEASLLALYEASRFARHEGRVDRGKSSKQQQTDKRD